ncbi:MAG: metalloregulator ArsR/SmtB family transcription factor [Gemmatimonadota bacterium]
MSDPALCHVRLVHQDAVDTVQADQALDDELTVLAETFHVLAHPTRLRIVEALSAVPELCVCDLSVAVGASESAVSHQLRQLRQLRMVQYRQEGRMAYYRLEDDHVGDLFRLGLDHVRE